MNNSYEEIIHTHFTNLIKGLEEATAKELKKLDPSKEVDQYSQLVQAFKQVSSELKEKEKKALENPKESAIECQLIDFEEKMKPEYQTLVTDFEENRKAYQEGKLSTKEFRAVKETYDQNLENHIERFEIHSAAIQTEMPYEQAKALKEIVAPKQPQKRSFREKVKAFKEEASMRFSKDRLWNRTKEKFRSTSQFLGKSMAGLGKQAWQKTKETKAAKVTAFAGKTVAVGGIITADMTGKVGKYLYQKSKKPFQALQTKYQQHKVGVIQENRKLGREKETDHYFVALSYNLGKKFEEMVNTQYAQKVTPLAAENFKKVKESFKQMRQTQTEKEKVQEKTQEKQAGL